nr:UDP-N-acetylglucosamine 2-epimerase [Streptomyces sp. SID14478]
MQIPATTCISVSDPAAPAQTGPALSALDSVLQHERPLRIVVYGDTISTLAAGLSAVMLHLPAAHLEAEAGLLQPAHARRAPPDPDRP